MALPICGKGYLDVVEELIRSGADVNVKWNGNTPLIMACHFVYPEFVKVLVDAGADLNIVDNYGFTSEMGIQEPFTIEPKDNATNWEKIRYAGTLEKLKVPENTYWKEQYKIINKKIEECHNILRQKKLELTT